MTNVRLYTKRSGRADLNRRPPRPKRGALTELRYAPYNKPFDISLKTGKFFVEHREYNAK